MQDDLLAIPFRIYAMMVMFLQTLVNVCLRRLRPASTQLGPHACRVPRTQPEALKQSKGSAPRRPGINGFGGSTSGGGGGGGSGGGGRPGGSNIRGMGNLKSAASRAPPSPHVRTMPIPRRLAHAMHRQQRDAARRRWLRRVKPGSLLRPCDPGRPFVPSARSGMMPRLGNLQ